MQPPGCAPMGGHSTPNPAAVYLEAVTQTHTHIHASLQCVRGAQRPHLCPLTKASPPVVLSSPVSILKVLVFPAPLTPRSPKHSPGRTPRHRRSTARIRPIFRDLYTWPKSLTPQQRMGLLPGPAPPHSPSTSPQPEPTLVRFSILTMSLSASPRSTLCRSLATSTSSSTGLVDTGKRLGQYSGQGLANPPTPTKGPCHRPTLLTHCGCRRKLYWHMIVRKNPTKPSTVMATSPRVTMSHSNGDFILSNWPVEQAGSGPESLRKSQSPQC